MASPFALFRRHERLMMATVGLMAILAFVFLDPFTGRDTQDKGQNPVVVTTKYGKITVAELERMRRQKQLANGIVQQGFGLSQRQNVPFYFGRPTDETVLDTMVLARKAKDLGMYIGDDEVTRFLRQVSSDQLTAEHYAEMLRSFNERQQGGQHVSKAQLYDILREQMSYKRLSEMFVSGLEATPAERWDEYSKLKKQVSASIVPVMVADFLDKVNDPTDAKLTEFYDKYKNDEPLPGSPTPGFKIPAKVMLAYFKADFEKFKKEVTVTDAEVAEYYEKNKIRFPYRADAPADEEEKAADAKTEDKTDEAPKDADKPADNADKPADEKPADAKPADEKPADAAPQQSASASADGNADDVSLCQDKGAEAKATDPKGEEPATPAITPAATDDANKAAEPAAAADAAPQDGPDIPAATKEGTGGELTTEDALKFDPTTLGPVMDVEPLPNQFVLPDDVHEGPTPEHDPLWKVEKKIRDDIAKQKALEKIKEVFAGIQDKMRRYSNERNRWEARRAGNKDLAAPKPLDFAALAAEAGVTAETTPAVTAFEFSKLEGIGSSFSESSMLWQFAFGQGQLFQPVVSEDADGNQYLSWKTEQSDARVPELKEIHDVVVRSWKMIEARKPAREHADALAETARREKITLKDLAERDKLTVEETGTFSWLTRSSAGDMFNQAPPRLTEVEGVEDAGEDFMRAVFELPLDGIGVGMNNPQTIAYVVQVTSFQPAPDVLHRTFFVDRYDYGMVGYEHRLAAYSAWLKAQREEADVKWEREPQQLAAMDGEDE